MRGSTVELLYDVCTTIQEGGSRWKGELFSQPPLPEADPLQT